MNNKEFMQLKIGDRIETRAGCRGTVVRVYVDEDRGYPLAAVHFDGDPASKTFTVWASVVVERLANE
jgi:hypothetical protein